MKLGMPVGETEACDAKAAAADKKVQTRSVEAFGRGFRDLAGRCATTVCLNG